MLWIHRYLGPRTEYNTNLPPAAFPSIDPLEPLEARQVQDAPSQASRLPTRSHFADERPDTSQSKRLPTSSTGNIVHDWGREDIRGSQPGSSKVQGNADFWMASTEHRVIDSPQATDLWDRISIYYRLMVLDAVIAAYDPPPDEFQALHRLPLKNTQIQEMVRVLRDRQARSEVEEQAHRKLVRSTTSHLMKSNEPMSEEKFRAALDRTIYKDIEQSDHLVTRLGDLHHARQFLAKVGFDPELLDDVNRSSHPILQEPSGTSRQRLESQAPTGVQLGRASDADPTSSGNPVLKLEIKECTPKPAGANVVSKIAPACDCTPPPCSSAHTLEKNGSSRPHCPIAPVCIATPLEHLPDESHYASDDSRYLDKQTRHNRRAVAAAVHSNPLLRSGTALTGGGGTRGLNSTSTMMKDRPAGDYIFGDWVERMNTIHVENKSMLKNRRILDLMEEDISSQDAI